MRVSMGTDIRRLRLDAGLSQRRLAESARIHFGHLSLIERGLREPSLAVLTALADALGGSLSVRVYPGTGPRLRDPIQARITEALLRTLDPRWTRLVEVPVYKPARGVIDIVTHDQAADVVVATEVQSELRRLEQQVRWSNEKAESLPSADFWRFVARAPRIDRLLVLRSTPTNRQLVERFGETLRAAYPASAGDAFRALTSPDAPWPGSAILWAEVDGDAARILDHPPRHVSVGRMT
jgi:transcriptional regulator with XRE-family HTH domain